MAEMTTSIEPCAVCTIAGAAHPRQHAHAVEIRHHEVENDKIDRRPVRSLETGQRSLARLRGFDVITESSGHRLKQPALDGIVINNEYESGHRRPKRGLGSRALRHTVTSR
jgi:hypothetical protein